MVQLLKTCLNKFPWLKLKLKKGRDFILPKLGASSGYIVLSASEAVVEGERLRDSWFNDVMVKRQRELVEQQLCLFRAGKSIDVFDVFVNAVLDLPDLELGMSLLEIGCSSGFYSEVVEISNLPVKYSGCDYSQPFIEMAIEKYPAVDFSVQDATALNYAERSFDIVVSGCCLLHIPDYATAIEETARVADRYAIFHRTPVVWGKAEQWFRKKAYGKETIEIHFNEPQFLTLLAKNGLEILSIYTLSEEDTGLNQGNAVRSYVCRKKCP